jgi:hypothetical protein
LFPYSICKSGGKRILSISQHQSITAVQPLVVRGAQSKKG